MMLMRYATHHNLSGISAPDCLNVQCLRRRGFRKSAGVRQCCRTWPHSDSAHAKCLPPFSQNLSVQCEKEEKISRRRIGVVGHIPLSKFPVTTNDLETPRSRRFQGHSIHLEEYESRHSILVALWREIVIASWDHGELAVF